MLAIALSLLLMLSGTGVYAQTLAGAYVPGTYTATAQGNNGPSHGGPSPLMNQAITGRGGGRTHGNAGDQRSGDRAHSGRHRGRPDAGRGVVSGATFTSKAILEAVEDCVTQAGGDAAALKAPPRAEKRRRPPPPGTRRCWWWAGGIAGLTAAARAADQGAKVLLIDKMPALGGTTITAGAYFLCVGSSLQNPRALTTASTA
jgi:fumarate reductase flavoprotein subunit